MLLCLLIYNHTPVSIKLALWERKAGQKNIVVSYNILKKFWVGR